MQWNRIDRWDDDRQELEHKTSSNAKPLEALLIEKNRQLQNEVTNWRVANTELEASTSQTKQALEQASGEILRLKTLNERLEEDLINLKPGQSRSESAVKGMSAEEALAEMDKIAQDTKGGDDAKQADSTSQQRQTAPIPFDASKGSSSAKAGAGPSSASSILPIITSQRDRFRARNAELEEELRKQFETISELRAEVKTLQSDNLGMYEKMRYLQAYGNSANNSNASQSFRGPAGGSRIINVSARNDAASYPPNNNNRGEDKYRDKYEAAMNPFEQFRGRVRVKGLRRVDVIKLTLLLQEQSRAFNSLNPLERVLHILTRLVLGHRRMRIFFIVYAISLHLLVFAMLFEIEFYR